MPDELLLPIGEHLISLGAISSLKAAATTNRRLNGIFSSLRVQSEQKLIEERAQFNRQLDRLTGGPGLRSLFYSLRDRSAELRWYLANDAIDYVSRATLNDEERRKFLVALFEELPHLVSQSELPRTAARVVRCHNLLSPKEQGPSLVALAELIKHFPPDASELWIARLTHIVSEQRQHIGPYLLQALLCKLADLTSLVSDEKKGEHVYCVFALMQELSFEHWAVCNSHLAPYREYTTFTGLVGTVAKSYTRQLTQGIRDFLGRGQEP